MRKIFTVDEQDLYTLDSWRNDYETREEAIYAAYDKWSDLTKAEKKHRLIEVYEDAILVEKTEDDDEERLSWEKGYDTILALKHIDEDELADKLWEIFSDYVPVWDREDDTEDILRDDPELALVEFLDSLRNDLEDDPDNEYIQEAYNEAKKLWIMSK